jgi:sensor histidine kinase YesM
MMLLTLVENAIKHGINPLTEGGAISVRATRGDSGVQLSVVDSGRGMTATAGSGTGLSNIRSRLALLYGNAAALRLSRAQPQGVAATITIPMSVGV